jgi:hypothetical protein
MTVGELILKLQDFPEDYTVKIETPGMIDLTKRDACLVQEDEYDDDAICIYS